MEVGHSRLLKFFMRGRHEPDEMAETPVVIKIHKDFESPPNVEAEVPGTQTIREVDDEDKGSENATSSSETQISEVFSSTPVITVTKKESTLTKGDMKMQKVTVTEDISVEEEKNGGYRVFREVTSSVHTDGEPDRKTIVTRDRRKKTDRGDMETEEKTQEDKRSKIPIMRLKQVVEKVKKERQEQKSRVKPRRSSIPKLKDAKAVIKRDTSLQIHPRLEDEFDKLYDEIVDDKQKYIDDKILADKVEDTEKVESKFEEIIHAYDEAAIEKQSVSRISKIPALRRRDDDRPSKIGALVDKVKAKNTVTETKLKDGGFKVTASNIKMKRFARNNSRDMTAEDQKLEVTETINIKESMDNGVVVTETIKTAPVKPKRSIRSISKDFKKDDDSYNIVKTIDNTEDGGSKKTIKKTVVKETVETSTPVNTERIAGSVSEDMSIDDINTFINENFKDINNADNKDIVTVTEVKDGDNRTTTITTTVRENVKLGPVKTERIIRGISKEITKDVEHYEGATNSSNKETVTVEEFENGDNHRITTKTITKETMRIGTPEITETVIRNSSRKTSTEAQHINTLETNKDKDIRNHEIVTVKQIGDEGSKKITKETTLKENIKIGIPIKSERFTRDISREMGNLKQSRNKEIVTMEEVINDGQKVYRKTITKENVKGIPVRSEKIIYNNSSNITELRRSPDRTNKQITTTNKATRVTSSQINNNNSKEILKSDNSKDGNRIQNMETENIVKESIKIDIPVFTKVTQSFSKGRIQNVEMSRTIEWKPADEVRTNNYKRSISEKVTKKELKDIDSWKYGASVDVSEDKDSVSKNDILNKEKQKIERDSVSHDGFNESNNEIIITNITEYQSKEQETNVEKTTFSLSKTIDLTVESETKEPREMHKQISLVDSIRREADFKQVSKELSKEINKDYSITDSVTETSEAQYSTLSTQEQDVDSEDVTNLKDNVSRLKNKICTKDNVGLPEKEIDEELPKKKSILSKIAIFERLEPREAYPVIKKIPLEKKNTKLVSKEINIEENPKIVGESRKGQHKFDFGHDKDKIEIDLNFEEVTYINKPVIVEEFWKTEKGNVPIVSTVNQVVSENTNLQRIENMIRVDQNLQQNYDFDNNEVLPAVVDYSIDENRLELICAPPDEDFEFNVNKPGLFTKSPEQSNHKTIEYEAPMIVPNKNNIDSVISKTRPGKIDFNIWKNQVEANKTLVDKKDILKSESLGELAKTLPGKTLLRNVEGRVQLSEDPPRKLEPKQNEKNTKLSSVQQKFEIKDITLDVASTVPIQYAVTKTLSGEVVSQFENGEALPGRIDIKIDDIGVVTTNPSHVTTDFEGNQTPNYIPEFFSDKPDFSTLTNSIVLPKILPDKTDYQHRKLDIKTSEKEVNFNKPIPGKLNLNLWKNQVEVNKTFVGKVKKKEIEIEQNLKSKTNLKTNNNQIQDTMPLPGESDLRASENRYGNGKTLPSKINFSFIDTQIETIRPLPGNINLSTTQSQVAEIINLPDTIEISSVESFDKASSDESSSGFEICEYQVEEIESLPVIIDLSTTENQTDVESLIPEEFESNDKKHKVATTLPGKLDLTAWRKQLEVNKTPVGTTISKTEVKEIEMIKSLPGKVDFITYESQIEESSILPGKLQKTYENNAQIDGVSVKTLPGKLPHFHMDGTWENEGHSYETVEDDIDLKTDRAKVEIRNHLEKKESLSDPELVDEPYIKVKENKDSIIGKIKKKMYFITHENIIQNSTNQPIETEISVISDSNESEYEKKVEDMRTKTYIINDKSMIKNTIGQTETIEQTVTIETPKDTNDKYYKTIEENYRRTDSGSYNYEEYEFNYDLNTDQNRSRTNIITTDKYVEEDSDIKTNENEFKFNTIKVQNELTRSAYGADDFKTTTEDLKRAKSLAELDLGDVINGQVRRMVGRIKSVDFHRRESGKVEKISIKEMPKKMSVMEKIALFEGKLAATNSQPPPSRATVTKTHDNDLFTEVILQKINELTSAKTRFGRMESMSYLQLANGVEMPVLAVGTALVDKSILPHLIGAAIDMGYRAIDTAYIYGNEKEVGEGIRAKIDDGTVKREDLFIMSKLWSTFHRTELVEEACKASLKTMGLDYFDLYMIHNPMSFKEGNDPIPTIATVLQYSDYDYLDAWFGMEGVLNKQLVRSIGLSNFNSEQIERILKRGKVKPVVNQVECHPYLAQKSLHDFCAARDIALSCFGCLGSKGTPVEYKNSLEAVIDEPLVKAMAADLNVTPAQLLIRFQIDRGHNVVVKSSTGAHLWDNLQALNFSLSMSEVDALETLNRNKRAFSFKGMGDTHKNYPFHTLY